MATERHVYDYACVSCIYVCMYVCISCWIPEAKNKIRLTNSTDEFDPRAHLIPSFFYWEEVPWQSTCDPMSASHLQG